MISLTLDRFQPFVGIQLTLEYKAEASERISANEIPGERIVFEFVEQKTWPVVSLANQDPMSRLHVHNKP